METKKKIVKDIIITSIVAIVGLITIICLSQKFFYISNDYEFKWYYTGFNILTGYSKDGIKIANPSFEMIFAVVLLGLSITGEIALIVVDILKLKELKVKKTIEIIINRCSAVFMVIAGFIFICFEPVVKLAYTDAGKEYIETVTEKFSINYYTTTIGVIISLICFGTGVVAVISAFYKSVYWKKIESVFYLTPIFIAVIYLWQYGYLHKAFGIETSSATFPYPFDHAVNSYSKFTGGVKGSYNSVFGSMKKLLHHSVSNTLDDSIWYNSQTTVAALIIGFIIGGVLGYLVALLATSFKRWGSGILTICTILVAFPVVALGPIVNHWFPSDSYVYSFIAKIVVSSILCMAGMAVNAFKGLSKTKPYAMDLMLLCNASKMETFTKLQFPNSLPNVFTALKVNTATALMGAFVCEFYSRSKTYGLGMWFNYYWQNARYQAWVYIILIIIYGLIMYVIVSMVEKRCIRWHASQRTAR